MNTASQLKLNQENSNKAIGKMTTLVNSLNAKVDAINKDEHWSRELYRAHKAATEFLNKKGPRQ